MLEFKARRLELFGQVRAVKQLERGHALTLQPIFQNTPDRLARQGLVQIRRCQAAWAVLILRHQTLPLDLRCPLGQQGQAVELHRVGVQRFLGHANSGRAIIPQQFLGGLDRHSPFFSRHLEGPGCRSGLADIDLVVNRTGHATLNAVMLRHWSESL